MLPVPHLATRFQGSLYPIEEVILKQVVAIESWFRMQWQKRSAPITSSVDLRHAGFKLAPVDTNLFPAGFNNLNPELMPLCVQAMQAMIMEYNPSCKKILLVPENHTRNQYYFQSLSVLKNILFKAGFDVRIGSIDPNMKGKETRSVPDDGHLVLEPVIRQDERIFLSDFDPCLVLLNNDLSTGLPPVLEGLKQKIKPSPKLGWAYRLKSNHFNYYDEVVTAFCKEINLDPWFINPYYTAVEGIDFMAQEGLEKAAIEVDNLLLKIKNQYQHYGIEERPFVVMKADNGTYGMSVMTVHSGDELRQMSRKQRTRMATSKGNQSVDKIILQEGVFTFETMDDGAVAEPVVYMIGQFVVGGFYRVHKEKGINENLNAPGMHFEPLAFAKPCNMPPHDLDTIACPNRFYVYGVIARLAALAAAYEDAASGEEG